MDSRNGHPRSGDHGTHVRLRRWLRKGLKGSLMLSITAAVTLLLFVYLLAALLRPEWF
ncbi:MAG: K(+)-transporting ATPase subunit F [Planctomycetaceae bacterium]|nr:MAG: K(+)-transporting ATPase subunit F [Planctomycetaceae bacterium]